MTYPYGTKGSPQVGRGVPGLPRPAGAPPAQVLAAAVADPAENTTLKFPARADWAQGWTTIDATVAGLPSGFGLAADQTYNGDGIGLASGAAFLLPYKRSSSSESYVGLFTVDGSTVTLVDSVAIPADYTANDAALINFVRTEWEDTFILCWGGVSGVANCTARLYVVKVNEVGQRVSILPDSFTLAVGSTVTYAFNIKAAYLRDGVFVVGCSYYNTTSGYSSAGFLRVLRITATGLSSVQLLTIGPNENLVSASSVAENGSACLYTRSTSNTRGETLVRSVLLTTGGSLSERRVRQIPMGPTDGLNGSEAGGAIIQCRRGTLTYLRQSIVSPAVLLNATRVTEQELAALTMPIAAPVSRLFDADAGGDGAMFVTAETTRRLMLYTPFMDTANDEYLRPVAIATLGSGSWMAAHLGRMIVSMTAAGGTAKIYRANAPL